MTDGINSGAGQGVDQVARRRRADPLLAAIAWDLATTFCGFVLVAAAVVLTVQGLSIGG